ncbi:MAG: hypothetical protein WBL40_03480 [Terrimicrobiaceae bacterium]
MTDGIALFPGKSAGGPLALNPPPFLRVSGTLWRGVTLFLKPANNQPQ